MLSFLLSREISDDLGQPVNCISMSNDGNCILASCLDSTLRLLDRYVSYLLMETYNRCLFLLILLAFLLTDLQVNYYRNTRAILVRLVFICLNLALAFSNVSYSITQSEMQLVSAVGYILMIVDDKLRIIVIYMFAFLKDDLLIFLQFFILKAISMFFEYIY